MVNGHIGIDLVHKSYNEHVSFPTIYVEDIEHIFPLKFVPNGPVNNISTLVQMMVCHLLGAKPLSEPAFTKMSDAIYGRAASRFASSQ